MVEKQGIGAAERLVQTMKRMLSRHVNDHPNAWLQSLSHIRMAYMSRTHTAIGGIAPIEMLMGYKVKLPAPVQSIFASSAAFTESEHVSRVQDNLHLLDEKAFAAIKKQFQENLQRFEKRRERSFSRKAGDLAIGDVVLEHCWSFVFQGSWPLSYYWI